MSIPASPIEWSKTRAYAVGLAGIYLNLRGREARGIVSSGEEAARLKSEIRERLQGLRDPDGDRLVIREAVDMASRYRGPYLDQSPDLMIGYADGCAGNTVRGGIRLERFWVDWLTEYLDAHESPARRTTEGQSR